MTHLERMFHLYELGWEDEEAGTHRICNEPCDWIQGTIHGVKWSAWISEVSGMVYLHTDPAIDLPFDEFCKVVRDGWPETLKAVAVDARQKSLFGDED